ncbi:DNA/RNA non-specific endonuclease [Sphingomonas oligophenolica]|uniref:Type VII secretion system protein EssD-like domain-containing protein n=1 Tax=Sphingomonas oligophenolica TaxID=301154 RepID=A0A502CG38_9SPHN|nr:DNA/RNA non-specific endonuclease [Sphingomonas oligophenolica]TPG12137.1 hypothetical protein EAH84_10345 [Sphingomonas oligophenolica]
MTEACTLGIATASVVISNIAMRLTIQPAVHPNRSLIRPFNGPTAAFNHFAQDAHFNMGGYRQLEGRIAKLVRQGRKVDIIFTPHYPNYSLRPDTITVEYRSTGHSEKKNFANRKGGK